MDKRITTIPAMPQLFRLKRVAAYARVSMAKDAMLHSLAEQVSYYSGLIQRHPEWQYAGVYADEAKTGTKEERPEFQRLLNDCRSGKIDMIMTKSVTRFARNTVTTLKTVRELKGLGVDVYFEGERIHTMSGEGELLLTILSAIAQEESRSASENQKVRIRHAFEKGELMCLRVMFGYKISCRRGRGKSVSQANATQANAAQATAAQTTVSQATAAQATAVQNNVAQANSQPTDTGHGNNALPTNNSQPLVTSEPLANATSNTIIEIDPQQAAIVREMYARIINGDSLSSIARWLNRSGQPGTYGGKWTATHVHDLLSNEKYAGNSMLQKSFRNDHIDKKKVRNKGQKPRYYVTETHPAIVSEATFAAAQKALAERAAYGGAKRAASGEVHRAVGSPASSPASSPAGNHSSSPSSPTPKPAAHHPFTGIIICPGCGRPYRHINRVGKSYWSCPTYINEGKAACQSARIPEEAIIQMGCEMQNATRFDERAFRAVVDHITPIYPKGLIFHFKDGREVRRDWQNKSRSASWTHEMRERARRRTREACQKQREARQKQREARSV